MLVLPTADPIPVRALNQITYRERLYYLEYVEALSRCNEHAEDGLVEHRRVAPHGQESPRRSQVTTPPRRTGGGR